MSALNWERLKHDLCPRCDEENPLEACYLNVNEPALKCPVCDFLTIKKTEREHEQH